MAYTINKRCCDCNRKVDDRAKRCERCHYKYRKTLPGNRKNCTLTQDHTDKISIAMRGKKNPMYKDGRGSKVYRCKRCHMPIHMYTYLNKRKLCKSCCKMGRHNPMKYRKNNIVEHHIYKAENSSKTIKLTDKIHSKLHSRAYDFIYEEYGKEGIHNYLKWFSKKYEVKL